MPKRITLAQAEARQLRKDATKLETVARHLRQRAKDLLQYERTDKALRAKFMAKPSKIDPSTIIEPTLFDEQFYGKPPE